MDRTNDSINRCVGPANQLLTSDTSKVVVDTQQKNTPPLANPEQNQTQAVSDPTNSLLVLLADRTFISRCRKECVTEDPTAAFFAGTIKTSI